LIAFNQTNLFAKIGLQKCAEKSFLKEEELKSPDAQTAYGNFQ
jgi:hypothetical protein